MASRSSFEVDRAVFIAKKVDCQVPRLFYNTRMQLAGTGRVVFWEGGSLWLAVITGVSERHSHHAIQLCLPIDGQAQFQADEGGDWLSFSGVLIAPGVSHAFRAPGKVVANLLFEPESVTGRRVLSKFGAVRFHELPATEVMELAAPLAAAYFSGADDDQLIALARNAVVAFADTTPNSTPTEARVIEAIAHIRRHLDEPIVLSKLARKVGLSAGRLRHLFVAETGVSFRAFVLWERLNRAMALGFGGVSWTEAAHAANFSDSAHLSRTCRRMFGIAPTSARIESPSSRKLLTA